MPAILQAVLILCSVTAFAQGSSSWHDPSPHRVQFVTVEHDVQLEVLDWGGTGRPIILLGGYSTAHEYDDFAPALTGIGHIYGITRRGFGASSRPESGYTSRRLSEDILCVLDTLKLSEPILIGHSFGSLDATILTENHPERIAALIYLSVKDPIVTYPIKPPGKSLPLAQRPLPDVSSFQAYQEWVRQTSGLVVPESELRQLYALNTDGSVGNSLHSRQVEQAMDKGMEKPDFARIKVPVLAFFSGLHSLEDEILRFQPRNEDQRAAVEQLHRFEITSLDQSLHNFKERVPSARIVELPHASSWVFLSNQTDVLREIEAFVGNLD